MRERVVLTDDSARSLHITTVGGNRTLDVNVTQSVPSTSTPSFGKSTDVFSASGNGTTVNVSTGPVKSYSIQVKGTGTWNVVLEISNDSVNFDTHLTHTNSDTGDGKILYSGTVSFPGLYFRSRAITATGNITVTIVGVA